MKIKTLVAVLFLSAGATTVVAQDDANCNWSHFFLVIGSYAEIYAV